MTASRVLLVADDSRPEVPEVLHRVESVLRSKVEQVDRLRPGAEPPRDAELAVVLGGDGTILSQGRAFLEQQLPIAGVNVGRLGFLAEVGVDSFARHAELVLWPDRPVHDRMTMEIRIERADGSEDGWHSAINDCVVTAGPPFRMIELRVEFNGSEGPRLTGDGVIIATPTGSTTYNVSVGGPIVHPACEAFLLTPIAAHSLAFRPVITDTSDPPAIKVVQANEGTTLVLDGQSTWTLNAGDRIRIRQAARRLRLIHNPDGRFWETVSNKMRWGTGPSYRDR